MAALRQLLPLTLTALGTHRLPQMLLAILRQHVHLHTQPHQLLEPLLPLPALVVWQLTTPLIQVQLHRLPLQSLELSLLQQALLQPLTTAEQLLPIALAHLEKLQTM